MPGPQWNSFGWAITCKRVCWHFLSSSLPHHSCKPPSYKSHRNIHPQQVLRHILEQKPLICVTKINCLNCITIPRLQSSFAAHSLSSSLKCLQLSVFMLRSQMIFLFCIPYPHWFEHIDQVPQTINAICKLNMLGGLWLVTSLVFIKNFCFPSF